MARLIRKIAHPDGFVTLVYDDGSRVLQTPTTQIMGRVRGTEARAIEGSRGTEPQPGQVPQLGPPTPRTERSRISASERGASPRHRATTDNGVSLPGSPADRLTMAPSRRRTAAQIQRARSRSAAEAEQAIDDALAEIDRLLAEMEIHRLRQWTGGGVPGHDPVHVAQGIAFSPELVASAARSAAALPPVLSETLDLIEAMVGVEAFTGRRLTEWERGIAGAMVLLPSIVSVASRPVRAGVRAAGRAATRATGQVSQSVRQAMRNLARMEGTLPSVRRALRALTDGRLLRARDLTRLRQLLVAVKDFRNVAAQRVQGNVVWREAGGLARDARGGVTTGTPGRGLARLSAQARNSLANLLASPRARRSLAAVRDLRIIRAINRFHSVSGFRHVVADFVSGVRNKQAGARFVMRYVEANFPHAQRTMRFEQARGRRRVTDFVADDVRYEFKSVREIRPHIVRGEGSGPRIGQLQRDLMDLLAQAPLSPRRLRWVFDSTKLPGMTKRDVVASLRRHLRAGVFRNHPRRAELDRWIEDIVELWP